MLPVQGAATLPASPVGLWQSSWDRQVWPPRVRGMLRLQRFLYGAVLTLGQGPEDRSEEVRALPKG